MRISQKGIDLIKRFEGLRLNAYRCPANVWTIGYGHTVGVKSGDKITGARAEELLRDDLQIYERGVEACVKTEIGQNQFDALVSFAFNLGVGALQKSTLIKKLNMDDHIGAAGEFPKWCKAGGKVLDGLVKRREAEQMLFLSDLPKP